MTNSVLVIEEAVHVPWTGQTGWTWEEQTLLCCASKLLVPLGRNSSGQPILLTPSYNNYMHNQDSQDPGLSAKYQSWLIINTIAYVCHATVTVYTIQVVNVVRVEVQCVIHCVCRTSQSKVHGLFESKPASPGLIARGPKMTKRWLWWVGLAIILHLSISFYKDAKYNQNQRFQGSIYKS